MVYTVTLNPAVDYILQLDDFIQGATNRAYGESFAFGGKGINVSTLLSRLGEPTTALGFVAGFTGKALSDKLHVDGINTDFVLLESGFTRINVKLKGYAETEINASGPPIPEDKFAEFLEKLDTVCDGDWCVLAGSIPHSLPQNTYEEIMKKLCGKNVDFVVDACGDLLLNTLKYKPFLIKPNVDELGQIAGKKLNDDAAIIGAAKDLQKQGAKNVLVSMGADGAILVDSKGSTVYMPPFAINAVDTVGAGDSMVAGFIYGMLHGYDMEKALRFSCACGAATASVIGIAQTDDIKKLYDF